MNTLSERVRQLLEQDRRRARWVIAFLCLAAIVMLATSGALRMRASTLTATVASSDELPATREFVASSDGMILAGSDGAAEVVGSGDADGSEGTIKVADPTDGQIIEVGDGAESDVTGDVTSGEVADPDATPPVESADSSMSAVAGKATTVTVEAPYGANLPMDSELLVTEIKPTSKAFKAYKKQALKALDTDGRLVLARFFDISIVHDGEKIQPEEGVQVNIELADAPASIADAEASVVHFAPTEQAAGTVSATDAKAADPKNAEVEIIDATADEGTTSFEAQSFSVYGVLYTVDFAYEEHEYSLPGGGQMLLSELLEALQIDAEIADVEGVEFSNPELLGVERAGEGATILRLMPDTSGDRHAVLVEDGEMTEEEAAEPLPDPRVEVSVDEGDWILTSLQSFEMPETLTVCTSDTVYAIAVTDPPVPSGPFDKGPWDLQDAAKIKVSYDSSYTSTPQERDATFAFHLSYHIDKPTMDRLRRQFTAWDAWFNVFPTFNYDLSEVLSQNNLEIPAGKTIWISSGKKRVAKLVIGENGKVQLQITDLNWFLGRTEIEGNFDLELQLDESQADEVEEVNFQFPGTPENINIKFKTKITATNKTVDATVDGDGNYILHYTAAVTNENPLSSLEFVDTIGGKQKLVEGSVKLSGQSVTVSTSSTGFTFSGFPKNSEGKVPADTYTITYDTKVSKEDFNAMRAGETSWETNKAQWNYNGDNPLDGGSTSYEIKKPAQEPPTVTKSCTVNGGGGNNAEVKPGDTITYTLTIAGTENNIAGLNILDNMTDLQYITGTPTITVDGTPRSDLVTAIFAAYNKDTSYSANNTAVINYTFPDDFQGNNVVITYTTKVIDQDTATANAVYGQANVNNTLSENRTWQNKTTTTTVKYEDETPTTVSKSIDEETKTEAEGSEQYKEYTYTIVVGDGTTTLDGVRVRDSISGNQRWIPNSEDSGSFTMTGNNISFNWAPTNANDGSTWNQTAFDFVFPAGTGKGPVIITYKTRTLSDEQAKQAGVYGEQTITNSVDTGTGQDSTSTTWTYPEEEKFPITKSVKDKDGQPLADSVTPQNGSPVQPGDVLSYSITFGNEDTTIDSTLRIMDEMTDVQDLTSDVVVTLPETYSSLTKNFTFWDGTKVEIVNGKFTMPKASNGWDNKGVTWGYFDDGSYSANSNVSVFNFQFPDITDNDGQPVKGPITVEYQTTVIDTDAAADSNVSGKVNAANTATSGNGSAQIYVTPTFGSLKHEAVLTKQFLGDELGWDKDGYTTWWVIRIEAKEGSSYPLSDLTLRENWDSNAIYYSTEYPVQNFAYNKLADIDLLGAEVMTDGGVTLQAGRDYTIDKQRGSFHFDQLDEAVTVKLAIHNPDATINTFYQHNQVELEYKKDKHNTELLVDNATCKRVKQDIDITKKSAYDEDSRIITWTVELNPYTKEVMPDWATVPFEDDLPDGLEYVNGSFQVDIRGSYWATTNPTPDTSAAGKLTVPDISAHSMWGASIDHTSYYNPVPDAATPYEKVDQGAWVGEEHGGVKVEGIGTGLSGTHYVITYKTKVPDSKWDQITSSLTGREDFTNKATVKGEGNLEYSASSTVPVESDNYLNKYDDTPESANFSGHSYVLSVNKEGEIYGYAEDGVNMRTYTRDEVDAMSRDELEGNGLLGNQLYYRIEVNQAEGTFNDGKHLTLTDRIDTNMELDTSSVMVYCYEGGEPRALTAAQLADQGITLSYNDDTRYLSISGLKDRTHYRVTYLTTMRAFALESFSNTATLIGGGSHSDKVTDSHEAYKVSAAIAGNSEAHLTVKKIDENNITVTLPGAEFKLYEVKLATPYEGGIYDYKSGDWKNLLEDVASNDEAVLAGIRKKYEIVGEVEVPQYDGEAIDAHANYLSSDYDTNTPATKNGDDGGYLTGDEGLLTFKNIKDRTLYFWTETGAPTDYTAALNDKHYFVVYVDEDFVDTTEDSPTLGEVLATAQERKEAAWGLDDACTIANGITVASMSSGTTWNVTNHEDDYTSITATKVWEGDYNDQYETRPKDGIQYDLYQIDSNGKQTLVADRSPVPINVNKNGYWDSYTWYGLSSEYTYTVKERPVPGYITSYSDDGKGIASGTLRITNTYIPKNTEIYVQKKWDSEDGSKPTRVLVKLYQITHSIDEDGKEQNSKPTYTGQQLALTASNGWKDGWTGLPTKDDKGNTLTYTVVEDVDAVNEETGAAYGPVYSDNGVGVVAAPSKEPLVITNVKDAPGSLKITKRVTVNGESITDGAADGVYRFRITDEDGNPAKLMNSDVLVGDVLVEVVKGKASSVMVDGLAAGTYYVDEYSTEGVTLTSGNHIKVQVEAGVTNEDFVDSAEFTNDISKTRAKVTKTWENASGADTWPSGLEIQVALKADGVEETEVLSAGNQSYMWDNLDASKNYTVEETGIRAKGSENFVPFDNDGIASVTVNEGTPEEKTYKYKRSVASSVTERPASQGVAAGTGKTYEFEVKNTQVTDVIFVKKWGAGGKEAWPAGTTITVQLYCDGEEMDEPVTIDSAMVSDARDALGGFTYSWHNLEANHVYSVEETAITFNGENKIEDYLVTQQGDLLIHNLPSKTSVTVTKQWADGGPSAWQVKGTLTRERRTMEPVGEWEPDLSYAATEFTLTQSESTATIENLELSGEVRGKLYEYRYIATETEAKDTSSSTVLTSSYDATVDGYSTITVTNTPKTKQVTVAKTWEGEAPSKWRVEGHIERKMRPYGSAEGVAWQGDDTYNADTAHRKTFTITHTMRNAKTTVEGLPESGYHNGVHYEYQYVAVEDEVYDTSGSSEVSIKDLYDAESTTVGDAITLSNVPKSTEITIKKVWRDKSENVLSEWPKDGDSDAEVTGWIEREKSEYGKNSWVSDPSYSLEFEVAKSDTHSDGGWAHSVGNLPASGYEGGVHYEYRYSSVDERLVNGYGKAIVKTGDGTSSSPYEYTITNTAQDVEMSVTVNKEWRDSAGHPLSDTTGKTATFELHQVRRAALVVNVTDLGRDDSGSVTLTISDGTRQWNETLNKADYVEELGWHCVLTPLEKGKTYTVTSATYTSGENVTTNLTLTSDSASVSGNDGGGGTVEYATGSATTTHTLHVNVQYSANDYLDGDDSGWIDINVAKDGGTPVTHRLEANNNPAWNYAETIESNASYVVSVNDKSGEYSTVYIYTPGVFTTNPMQGNQDIWVTLTAVKASPPATHTLTVSAKDANNQSLGTSTGTITFSIWKTPQGGTATQVVSDTLSSSNGWTYPYAMDDSDATYEVRVDSQTGFSSATINGNASVGWLSGSSDHDVTINAAQATSTTELVVSVSNSDENDIGSISFVLQKGNVDVTGSPFTLNAGNGWRQVVPLSGVGQYHILDIFGDGNTISGATIVSNTAYSEWFDGSTDVNIVLQADRAMDGSNQSGHRLSNVTRFFNHRLADTGDADYGMVDVVYKQQDIAGSDSYTWEHLPRFDEAGYPIEYYVVESDASDANAVQTHGEGVGYSKESALDDTGSVEFYNTVPETEATVKVRKQFVDAAGNALTSTDIGNANASFALKRYKNNPETSGSDSEQYTVNFYYSDGTKIGDSILCNENDIVAMSFIDRGNGWYYLHYGTADNRYLGNLQGNGNNVGYDFDNTDKGIQFRFRITDESVDVLKVSGDCDVKTDFSGPVKDVYLSFTAESVLNDFESGLAFTKLTSEPDGNSNDGSSSTTTVDSDATYTPQTISFLNDTNPNVTWTYNTEGQYWETTFPNTVPLNGANCTYTYYVEETNVPDGYEASYAVGENSASVSLPTSDEIANASGWTTGEGTEVGWLNGSGTVIVTNKDLGHTSVSVEKKWKNQITGEETTNSHDEDVQVTLYQYVGEPNVQVDVDELALPQGATPVEDSNVTNPVTLTSANRSYTWTNLQTQVNSQNVYYYVVETDPASSDTEASYTYTFNDGDDAGSGVKEATITNYETSFMAKKEWKVDGTDVTDYHTDEGHTVELTLYKKVGSSEKVRVAASDTIPNPVKLNANNSNAAGDLIGTWEYTWSGLPLRENDEDITYEVVETATNAYGFGTTYGLAGAQTRTYVEDGDATSGVKGVTITNNETSVEAAKAWQNGAQNTSAFHQGDSVTLQLYVARKVSQSGTFSVPATSDLTGIKFPQAAEGGAYASVEPYGDAVTLRYDAVNQNWHKKWDHLPTTQTVDGVVYELAYFVKEIATSAGDVSATYSYGTNDEGFDATSTGVKSVSIINEETDVTASKTQWGTDDASTMQATDLKHKDDTITLQLYKARMVDSDGAYKVCKSEVNGLTYVTEAKNGNGNVASFEACGDPVEVEYNATTKEWGKTWSKLPVFETDATTGKTYKLAYFVREVDTSTGIVSPTYSYVSADADAADGSGYTDGTSMSSGVKRVVIANEDTEVTVEKEWRDASGANVTTANHSAHNVTVQLYKARIAKDSDGGYKLPTYVAADGTLMLPEAIAENATQDGAFKSVEAFGPAVILSANSSPAWEHKWSDLPKYEVVEDDNGTVSTYELAYFVKETASSYGGATTMYVDYIYNDAENPDSGVNSVKVVNKDSANMRVQVNKIWGDGNANHADGSVTVRLMQKATDADDSTFEAVADSEVVLNADNNWTHIWENLDRNHEYKVEETAWTPTEIDVEATYRLIPDANNNILYAQVTNKPTYTGGLKITKTFDGLPAADASKDLRAEAGYKDLTFFITALANVEEVPAEGEGVESPSGDSTPEGDQQQTELPSNYVVEVNESSTKNDADYAKLKELADASNSDGITYQVMNLGTREDPNYQHQLTVHLSDFDAPINNGDGTCTYTFTVADSGLTMDKVFSVKETNAETLVDNYSIVSAESRTTGNGSIPKLSVATVPLKNTYEEIKGSIKVTKNVTLNGEQKFDDIAAQQRFKIGLEMKDGEQWTVVKRPDTDEDWIQTIVIGSGSTGATVFNGLPLGTYRAYEVDDNNDRVVAQEGEHGSVVNGVEWQVTETGTYYTYSVSGEGDGRVETRQMVTGDGTYDNYDGEGDVDAGGAKVTIAGENSDTGVILDSGTADEKAPRSAEITITNNKIETGRIIVNKRIYYNGELDTTALTQGSWYDNALGDTPLPESRVVRFGLYSDAAGANPVINPETQSAWIETLTMGTDDEGNSIAEGTVVFDGLDYEGGPYYVFEIDDDNQPIKSIAGNHIFGLSDYNVVSSSKGAQNVSHADQEKSITFTNSYSEKGKIKVTKYVRTSKGDADELAAGEEFTIGLFTKNGDTYEPVSGRTQTITVETSNNQVVGVALFENLDFDARGTTYYVFEVDGDGNPILATDTEGDDRNDQLNGYTVTYTNAGAEHGFNLTPEHHDFDAAEGANAGATVTNQSQGGDLRIKKIDKNTANDATPRTLEGAEFTITMLDETQSKVTYKLKSLKVFAYQKVATTNENGELTFKDVPQGYYEVKETAVPAGYLLVGDSTFYVHVDAAGGVTFLARQDDVAPTGWQQITNYNAGESNVLKYEAAVGAGTEATPATVTIGNTAGVALPAAGGPGTTALTVFGALLVVASACALVVRRRSACR